QGETAPPRPGAAGAGDPLFPGLGNGGYDVERYDLVLEVDPDAAEIVAACRVTATARHALSALNLEFGTLEIASVAVDGAAAAWERSGRELTVTPGRPIERGARFEVAVEYAGTPQPIRSRAFPLPIGWMAFGDESFVLSEPEGAASWFPCNDHPSDKALFTFAVTVPEGYTAAANGRRVGVDEREDGARTFRFEADEPMATYLATLAIGAFDVVEGETDDGVPLVHYLPEGTADDYADRIAFTAEVLPWLAERFGPYPFSSCGAVVAEVPFPGALETQTLPTYASVAFREDVIVHELAHQWFGNSVTVREWEDIWLAEGFAMFAMWLAEERDGGREAYDDAVREHHAQADGLGIGPPATPPVHDLFGLNVYVRGALVLHRLRVLLGDEAFFEMLRAWSAAKRHGNATTEEFVRHADAFSDDDVAAALEPWLYGEDVPELPAP
ncbi:MAG: M1 family metallopeptidase, partial [Planctomycetota bacterium JB042]